MPRFNHTELLNFSEQLCSPPAACRRTMPGSSPSYSSRPIYAAIQATASLGLLPIWRGLRTEPLTFAKGPR